jgi:hypothetical protein
MEGRDVACCYGVIAWQAEEAVDTGEHELGKDTKPNLDNGLGRLCDSRPRFVLGTFESFINVLQGHLFDLQIYDVVFRKGKLQCNGISKIVVGL